MKSLIQEKSFKKLFKMVNECHNMCIYLVNQHLKKQRKFITSKEIVEKYYISNRTLQRFRSEGKLLPVGRSRYYIYNEEQVEEFFKTYRIPQNTNLKQYTRYLNSD